MIYKCGVCEKTFTAYNKNAKYCSKACKYKGQKNRVSLVCDMCSKEYERPASAYRWSKKRGSKHTFCSKTCKARFSVGENSPTYKGGRYKTDAGYVLVLKHDHPRPVAGSYVYEHTLVMETGLGRSLEGHESVHHKNGVKDDNRLENLELLTYTKHALLHQGERERNAKGQYK